MSVRSKAMDPQQTIAECLLQLQRDQASQHEEVRSFMEEMRASHDTLRRRLDTLQAAMDNLVTGSAEYKGARTKTTLPLARSLPAQNNVNGLDTRKNNALSPPPQLPAHESTPRSARQKG